MSLIFCYSYIRFVIHRIGNVNTKAIPFQWFKETSILLPSDSRNKTSDSYLHVYSDLFFKDTNFNLHFMTFKYLFPLKKLMSQC